MTRRTVSALMTIITSCHPHIFHPSFIFCTLWCRQSWLFCVWAFLSRWMFHAKIKVVSYSLKHMLYHAPLRGLRAPFVNSISAHASLRCAADRVTGTVYCGGFLAALETIPCSALPLSLPSSRIKGTQLQTEILWGSELRFREIYVIFMYPHVTKTPVFVTFRYSHGMGSATPLIRAKTDDPSWWRWRAGWATGWSSCWTSSRMNTCLCGGRLVSSPGGKTSAETSRLSVYLFLLSLLINLAPKWLVIFSGVALRNLSQGF